MAILKSTQIQGDLTVIGSIQGAGEIQLKGGSLAGNLSLVDNSIYYSLIGHSINLFDNGEESKASFNYNGDLIHIKDGISYTIMDSGNYTPPVVDSELNNTSTNAVQNKVINSELSKKENLSNKSSSITSSSTDTQYPTSKAVYNYLNNNPILPVGCVWWCSYDINDVSTTTAAVSHSLVCNGQQVSQSTYSSLYDKIKDKYNQGDETSGYFRVPNLLDNNRFIRASSTVGVKQDDKIRNITGTQRWGNNGCTGAFNSSIKGCYEIEGSAGYRCENTSNGSTSYTIFNANANTNSYGNPMAGHANGDDIHPYNISMIPMIAF